MGRSIRQGPQGERLLTGRVPVVAFQRKNVRKQGLFDPVLYSDISSVIVCLNGISVVN